MPALTNNPAFTALDVQDALLARLNADQYIQATFLNAGGAFNEVLDDDPLTVSKDQNALLVVTLASEGAADATLGGTGGGTEDVTNTFAVLVYLWEGDNRLPATKRRIIQMTGIARAALMRNRQIVATPAGGTTPIQMVWSATFRNAGKDTTTYYTPKGYRYSVTLIDLVSRLRYM